MNDQQFSQGVPGVLNSIQTTPGAWGQRQAQFSRYVWGVLIYNLVVILWGAYVRVSFSGDGCGAHWPMCGNALVSAATNAPKIEGLHRLSTGVVIPLILVQLIFAFRLFPKGHPARVGSVACFAFTFSEALIGAVLVLYKLVAHNPSAYRALADSMHLVNTFLLIAALTLTAWWSGGNPPLRLRAQGAVVPALAALLIASLFVGVSGHIAALGDMLFPSDTLMAGLRADFSPTASFLVHLRPLHPFLSVALGIYAILLSRVIGRQRPQLQSPRFAHYCVWLFVVQIAAGFLNLFLNAPIWMQIVHLFLADLLWIDLILLSAAALGQSLSVSSAAPLGNEVSV
ncbi:MAG: protoheme farnesyltransferase [Chthonomonadaceae bacterium]|nr:protoheme farnesyltransferase [Chthonomonadaceae bacterium]